MHSVDGYRCSEAHIETIVERELTSHHLHVDIARLRHPIGWSLRPLPTSNINCISFKIRHILGKRIIIEPQIRRKVIYLGQSLLLILQIDMYGPSMYSNITLKSIILENNMLASYVFQVNRTNGFIVISQSPVLAGRINVIHKVNIMST